MDGQMGQTGGGAASITADLAARALIAAARSYGDDPVAVLTKSGKVRRSLAPCIYGVAAVMGRPIEDVAPLFGASAGAAQQAYSRNSPGFTEALKAAERAARFARWRPEASASVAAEVDAAPAPAKAAEPIQPPAAAPVAKPTGAVAGPISSRMLPVSFHNPLPASEIPLSQRILEELEKGEASCPALTHKLDAKELPVSEALRTLCGMGQVERVEPVPAQGARFQKWRRVAA